ncbi:hypothetical protein [Phreatobacter stygius]|uniref:Uncharacterized protein n=1 Tax=Phreatobacter stygius TaxID=1940610 RepID=A0A4D7BA50_9HYPH|nr:hypothetical protein [Phreatobacter stygius]QCI67583.1 hypothetical protein E8M01_27170 [Phreatobacter stygius]
MTRGERFVAQLPEKTYFHDRNERRGYEVTRLVAARLIDHPELVQHGRAYMERHMKTDPSQRAYYRMWQHLLRHDIGKVVRDLLEDSDKGSLLRDTQPVFYVPSAEERQAISTRPKVSLIAPVAIGRDP